MSYFLLDISIVLNILGLSVVSALEALRPGSVNTAIHLGIVWLIALVLCGIALFIRRPNPKTTTK